MSEKWAAGVDIGGTKITVAQVDSSGSVHQEISFGTRVSAGAEAIESDIIKAIKQLSEKAGSNPAAIGVGMAGQIEAKTGLVHFAPNLKWRDVPLQEDLEKAFSIPVTVINDVRAATWAEWHFGAGKKCKDLVCMFVGTGIGGGIVSGGKLLTGSSNTAGEIGHIRINLNGPECTCGGYGCLEAIAGGWGIARMAQKAVADDPVEGIYLLESAKKDPKLITAKVVIQAYYAGDPFAKLLIDEVTEALIAGTVTIVNMLNPSRIVFGGGIIHGLPELVDWIEESVKREALPAATSKLEIMLAELENNAPAIGAATYALKARRQEIGDRRQEK